MFVVEKLCVFSLTYFHPPNIFSFTNRGKLVSIASVITLGLASALFGTKINFALL